MAFMGPLAGVLLRVLRLQVTGLVAVEAAAAQQEEMARRDMFALPTGAKTNGHHRSI
jgi:hypothetical protein